MIIVTGSATARPDTIAEMTRIALEHVHRSRTEEGCLLHGVHVDAENPLRLTFMERWADADALRKHFAVPESSSFIKRLRELAAEFGAVEVYDSTRLKI